MNTRIFCQHCDSHYEVDLEEARLVQKYHNDRISFENNTYYFRNTECFFHLVKQLKRQNNQNK
ncbi:MAG: hypothetical protein OQK45_06870 [Sulfurovum sp.]|nr:hypothetical protein [Sulfurovum sp.]